MTDTKRPPRWHSRVYLPLTCHIPRRCQCRSAPELTPPDRMPHLDSRRAAPADRRLTGQHTAGMLAAAAREAGIQSVAYELSQVLGRCGLRTELAPGQFADAIAEGLHAGAPDGTRVGGGG